MCPPNLKGCSDASFAARDRGKASSAATLIYGIRTSLDGYTEDEHGKFGCGAPEDAGGQPCINEFAS